MAIINRFASENYVQQEIALALVGASSEPAAIMMPLALLTVP